MRWFDRALGVGRIRPDGGGLDAVAEQQAVQSGEGRPLMAGDRVQFDLKRDAEGTRADNIRRLRQDRH
ncbi:cold shock domain-containing protein [Streptomyces orinoci]|uniref:Cold shock domain-containing protein n=1 Tax=Streptomyces orinoci TaxID=67339 RepID=A0ABV3JUI5_STRON